MPYEVTIELAGPALAHEEITFIVDALAPRRPSVEHADANSSVSVLMPADTLGEAVASTLTELCQATSREPIAVRAAAHRLLDLARLLDVSPTQVAELIDEGKLLPPMHDA
ncbi:MAG: hypothetical protein PSX37_11650 [bacterium]|nr:hypothetical protein [bacterium]